MGRRHFTKPFNILNEQDASTGFESAWTDVSQYDNISYLIDWTDTVDGVLSVVSSDKNGGGVEHKLDFGSIIPINDSVVPKQHQIVINTIAQSFFKLSFESTSGTGVLNAVITMTSKGA
jgi:hypothetical protein